MKVMGKRSFSIHVAFSVFIHSFLLFPAYYCTPVGSREIDQCNGDNAVFSPSMKFSQPSCANDDEITQCDYRCRLYENAIIGLCIEGFCNCCGYSQKGCDQEGALWVEIVNFHGICVDFNAALGCDDTCIQTVYIGVCSEGSCFCCGYGR